MATAQPAAAQLVHAPTAAVTAPAKAQWCQQAHGHSSRMSHPGPDEQVFPMAATRLALPPNCPAEPQPLRPGKTSSRSINAALALIISAEHHLALHYFCPPRLLWFPSVGMWLSCSIPPVAVAPAAMQCATCFAPVVCDVTGCAAGPDLHLVPNTNTDR